MAYQLRLTVSFFLFGLFTGVLYDTARIIRLVFFADRKRRFDSVIKPIERFVNETKPIITSGFGKRYCIAVTAITDTVFSLSSGVCFTVYLYSENNLIFRWYLLLSSAFGFAAYYFTVGKVIMTIASLAQATAVAVVRALILPIKKLVLSAVGLMLSVWRLTGGRLVLHLFEVRYNRRLKAEEARLDKLLHF